MPEIGLNAYLDEAKELVRTNSLDEAIAICRHILKQHPKYIEAYRVLAEASLEKAEHGEALDLFKRVLSADPENLIAYIGQGIILNEDGLTDEAIWQFERAFEISPGNAEIRRELKRLYTQRDGVEQPRLKLNRTALARLYAKGGFYPQAISELQSILSSDPERIDIQLALAETLWYDNRKREAAEVCQDILNKLPHCLKANLLLGEIWLRSGLEEDGNTLLKRAEALDPENKRAHEMFGELSPLPAQTVTIEKLSAAELAAATTGLAGKEPAAAERLDDWMQALKAPAAAEPSPAEQTIILPETALREGTLEGKPAVEMRETGQAEAREELTAGEESPVIESLEKEFGALPEIGQVDEAERAKLAASMPPETASASEIIAWLRQQSATPVEEPVAVQEEPAAPTEEPLSVQEEQAAPAAKRPEEEGSPVIAALEAEFGALPELTTAAISAEEQSKLAASIPPETASAEEIMAWLRQQSAAPEAPVVEQAIAEAPEPIVEEVKAPEVAAPGTEEVLAWLRAIPAVPVEEEVAPIAEQPIAEAPAIEEAPEVAAPGTEEVLAWLRATPAVPIEEEAAPVAEQPIAEAPAIEEAPAVAAEQPIMEAPAIEEEAALVAEQPIAEAPAIEEAPAVVAEQPMMEAPVVEETPSVVAEQPVTEAPVVEEAPSVVAEQPIEEAPALVVEPVSAPIPEAPPLSAIEQSLAALAANPEDHGSRLALADALAQEYKWAEAAEQYGQLVRTVQPLDSMIGRLTALTEAHPEQLALQQILGDAYMEAGRFDEAMAKYNWLLGKV